MHESQKSDRSESPGENLSTEVINDGALETAEDGPPSSSVPRESLTTNPSHQELADGAATQLEGSGSDVEDAEEDSLSFLVEDNDPDELDYGGYEYAIAHKSETAGVSSGQLTGAWTGACSYPDGSSDGIMKFSITTHDSDGAFEGSGTDALGDFVIVGVIQLSAVVFLHKYTTGGCTQWRYEGEITAENDEMTGCWGKPGEDESILSSTLIFANGGHIGSFRLSQRPIEYFQFRPRPEEFAENNARALWKYALNSVIHGVRVRNLSWEYIRDRRDQRLRFIELYTRRREMLGGWGEQLSYWEPLDSLEDEELDLLERTLNPADLRFYRSIARFYFRRETVHA